MGSKTNCSLKGKPRRFMLESLNRLMDDLSADNEVQEHFVTVKEEPKDNYFEGDIPLIKLEESSVGCDNLPITISIKRESEEFDIEDCDTVLPEERDIPLHLTTEVIIKKEYEQLDCQFLNCIEDFKNKSSRIVLRRFKCFMCDHCPLFYKTKKNLARHIHSNHFLLFQNPKNVTKSLISCVICNKKLLYKSWHEHMTIVHSVNKFLCKYCHRVFKHENYLNRHVRRRHEKRKPAWNLSDPVECPVCLKMFSNKHALHTHNKTSHSAQTYTCKVCNSTLKCKTYLNAHMRRVHYDDGKMHVCDICTKNFKSPRYLKIHKKNKHYSL